MRRRAEELLSRIGANLDVNSPMRTLSTAQEQIVQIAAAVGTGAKILVFDEPTSSLAEPDAQNLFKLIEQLSARVKELEAQRAGTALPAQAAPPARSAVAAESVPQAQAQAQAQTQAR